MVCNECELIELEILSEPDTPLELEVDFEGEVVSGSTGEEYQNGYDKGKKDGYNDGHEAGYTEGHKDGYDEGKAEGDSWYDTFWDSVQENGNRTDYAFAFYKNSWNDISFKPKYDIQPSSCANCFAYSKITDLVSLLNDCGVTLDMSNCRSIDKMFEWSSVTHIGVISAPKAGNQIEASRLAFSNCLDLHTIDKFILPASFRCQEHLTNTFSNCSSLENLTLEGTIYRNADFKSSPLTATSAKNGISCLANYAGTENEFLYTISFSETTWGYLDAEGETASPNGNSWRAYISELGWLYK